MGQKGFRIAWWYSCSDLRDCTRRPLPSPLVLVLVAVLVAVGSSVWIEATHQLQWRHWFGLPSLPLLISDLPLVQGSPCEPIEFLEICRTSGDALKITSLEWH
jgi:hypothetical protein